MRKKVFGRKFGRGRKAREALFRGLIRAVVLNGKIITTKAKAKGIQADLEKFVSWAKEGSVGGRRKVLSELGNDRETADKLFGTIAPLFKSRPSGYTKITYLPRRLGDSAEMARIEWTEQIGISNKVSSDRSEKGKTQKSKEKISEKKQPIH